MTMESIPSFTNNKINASSLSKRKEFLTFFPESETLPSNYELYRDYYTSDARKKKKKEWNRKYYQKKKELKEKFYYCSNCPPKTKLTFTDYVFEHKWENWKKGEEIFYRHWCLLSPWEKARKEGIVKKTCVDYEIKEVGKKVSSLILPQKITRKKKSETFTSFSVFLLSEENCFFCLPPAKQKELIPKHSWLAHDLKRERKLIERLKLCKTHEKWKRDDDPKKRMLICVNDETNSKQPMRKGWANNNYREAHSIICLKAKNGSYAVKNGARNGNYFESSGDFDFLKLKDGSCCGGLEQMNEREIKKHKEKGFTKKEAELLTKRLEIFFKLNRIRYRKTKHGFHFDILCKEQLPNLDIGWTNLWGEHKEIGSIQSKGRLIVKSDQNKQEMSFDGKDALTKEGKLGKWYLKSENLKELREKFNRCFFEIGKFGDNDIPNRKIKTFKKKTNKSSVFLTTKKENLKSVKIRDNKKPQTIEKHTAKLFNVHSFKSNNLIRYKFTFKSKNEQRMRNAVYTDYTGDGILKDIIWGIKKGIQATIKIVKGVKEWFLRSLSLSACDSS